MRVGKHSSGDKASVIALAIRCWWLWTSIYALERAVARRAMYRFQQALRDRIKPLIFGLIHLDALPGTPRYKRPLKQILEKAKYEALILKEEGVDGMIVENMGDIPFVRPHETGPEIVACMTRCAAEIKRSIYADHLLWGISMLAACNQQALAVAQACDYDFVRVEGYVFGHVADEGYIDGCAGSLLRYRKKIDAEHVAVITDVKKKHSAHSITADVSLTDTIHAAEFFLTDGIVITGSATGVPPNQTLVKQAREASSQVPLFIGSGLNSKNVQEFVPYVDGLIVGSDFKVDGHWENELDRSRVSEFMNRVREAG